ncbi:MAG TPA: hypothetical protein VNZ64_17665 [Candidatus Acidoferrum sp.]|nr:hypothetical protein [Candidatus Acidoferrum sp.]
MQNEPGTTPNQLPSNTLATEIQPQPTPEPPVSPKSDEGGSELPACRETTASPAINHQLSTINHEPPTTVIEAPSSPFKRRPRTGAFAQLPKPERDMACRMISERVPYKRISQALLQAGYQVSERNISNWVTHGGFLEWTLHRDAALQSRLRQDDLLEHHRQNYSNELAEVGLQAAATRISEILTQKTASSADLEANLAKYDSLVKLLCRINKELLTAQQFRQKFCGPYSHNPASVRYHNEENVATLEKTYSAESPAQAKQLSASSSGMNALPGTPASAASDGPTSLQAAQSKLKALLDSLQQAQAGRLAVPRLPNSAASDIDP